jgi:DNA recombination protein RmuC
VDAQAISIIIALLVGVAFGAVAAWLAARGAHAKSVEAAVAKTQAELGAELARITERSGQQEKASALVRAELDAEKQARSSAESEVARLNTTLAELRITIENERRSAEEKLALLDEAKQKLSSEFQLLANRIFEDKSSKLSDQNKTALGELLDPLRTQLREFKGKVEEVYVQEGKDRSALSEQVKQLLTLNQSLSQDAQNLTDALKGNAQVRGAWGEWVLEEMLTSSGLMKDEHYVLQDSKTREDGTRARPDALINMPGGRQLVVDAKVSLVAYDQYTSAKGDEERALALRGHLDSMKKHITGLSDREYQKLYPTMDFVMMFVPIEPAFMVAAANEKQLFSQAWEKNVLLVSPSTLLFVLRTVAYLWRQEDQNRNAQAIADRGSKLYDKFCDFLKDLETLGQRLDQAHSAFRDARSKLHDGNGNLISQAKKLNDLGVKGSKKIPPALLQLADPEAEVMSDLASLAASNTPRETDPDTIPPAE